MLRDIPPVKHLLSTRELCKRVIWSMKLEIPIKFYSKSASLFSFCKSNFLVNLRSYKDMHDIFIYHYFISSSGDSKFSRPKDLGSNSSNVIISYSPLGVNM